MFNQDGLTDLGRFYSEVGDWKHDQNLFIVLCMLKQGLILDSSYLQLKPEKESTLEENAINLVCGIASLVEVELGDPWNNFDLHNDDAVNSFNYLVDLIRESVNNYIETTLYKTVLVQKLVFHKDYQQLYNKIKFKKSNGKYFATILKSVLQYNFPSDSGADNDFSRVTWPWLSYTSMENFVEVLKEALSLWDSVHKMVTELAEKSRLDYILIAFNNADYILKSKIRDLNIVALL